MKKSYRRIFGSLLGILAPFSGCKSFAIQKSAYRKQNNIYESVDRRKRSSYGYKNFKSEGISNSDYHKVYNYIRNNKINKEDINKENIIKISVVLGVPVVVLSIIFCVIFGGGEEVGSNDYRKYISDRDLTEDNLKQRINDIANKFNMIPYEGNNCYASAAMCMIADPRDLKARSKQLNDWGKLNLREKAYQEFIRGIRAVRGSDNKYEFLRKWKKKVKTLNYIKGDGKLKDISYEKIYNDNKLAVRQGDLAEFFNDLFIYRRNCGNLGFVGLMPGKKGKCNSERAKQLSNNPKNNCAKQNILLTIYEKQSINDCISNYYCLVDEDDFVTDGFVPHMQSQNAQNELYNSKVCKKLTGIKDSDSFIVLMNKKNFFETNPFGKLSVSKYQDDKQIKNYLVSDVAIHEGTEFSGHWYEDILIYDNQTLDSNEPKVIAIIKMNNTNIKGRAVQPTIISGKDNIEEELKKISTIGILYRYREIGNGIYSI